MSDHTAEPVSSTPAEPREPDAREVIAREYGYFLLQEGAQERTGDFADWIVAHLADAGFEVRPRMAVQPSADKLLAIADASSKAMAAQQEVARLIRQEAFERGKAEGIAEERQRAAAAIALKIRRELVCCDVYDRDQGTDRAGKRHAICFWGEAGARLAEDYAKSGGSDAA